MGGEWVPDIPNPLVLGGGGVAGRLEVWDAAGTWMYGLWDDTGLWILDADGSYVRLWDDPGGNAANISLNPADIPGHVNTPGVLRATSSLIQPRVDLVGPAFDAGEIATVSLFGGDTLGPYSGVHADANIVQLNVVNPVGIPAYDQHYLLDGAIGHLVSGTGHWFNTVNGQVNVECDGLCNIYNANDFQVYPSGIIIFAPDSASGNGRTYVWGNLSVRDWGSTVDISVPRGYRGRAWNSGDSAAIAAETVVYTFTDFVWRANRAYEILIGGAVRGTAASNCAYWRMRDTNLAGAVIVQWHRVENTVTPDLDIHINLRQIVRRDAATDLTKTVVITLERSDGAGNVIWHGDATSRRFVEIRDIGASVSHPEGVSIT